MSGVNRNIIGNLSIPLAGGGISTGPAELDLITTSGSRWVIFEFPSKFVSSSEGGLCKDLVLEWTTDPAMVTNPLASSSAYYAVTSSVISCNSASLSPLSSSVGWVQYIDSAYNNADYSLVNSFYYIRGYQRTIAGYNPEIYSNVASIQTRFNNFYGASPSSSIGSYVYNTDGYISGSRWKATPPGEIDYNGVSGFISSSVPLTIVKANGPNYDAIKTNGADLNFNSQAVGGNRFCTFGVGIVQGSVRIPTNKGDFFISATSSTVSGSVVFKNVSLQSGVNTINTIVSIGYDNTSGTELYLTVDDAQLTLIPGSDQNIQIAANQTWTTSADCIMRVIFAGEAKTKTPRTLTYPAGLYHQQYGN